MTKSNHDIQIDITIALPVLTVPGITLHHLVVGLETSVCNLGHRQLFVVSLQGHKTGILHYGNRRTGYYGPATKGVCSRSTYAQEMMLRSYSILSSYLLIISVISSYLLSPLSLLSLSSSLPLSLSLSLTTVKVVIELIPVAVVVAIVAWLLI